MHMEATRANAPCRAARAKPPPNGTRNGAPRAQTPTNGGCQHRKQAPHARGRPRIRSDARDSSAVESGRRRAGGFRDRQPPTGAKSTCPCAHPRLGLSSALNQKHHLWYMVQERTHYVQKPWGTGLCSELGSQVDTATSNGARGSPCARGPLTFRHLAPPPPPLASLLCLRPHPSSWTPARTAGLSQLFASGALPRGHGS